jgi:hypothetical protein
VRIRKVLRVLGDEAVEPQDVPAAGLAHVLDEGASDLGAIRGLGMQPVALDEDGLGLGLPRRADVGLADRDALASHRRPREERDADGNRTALEHDQLGLDGVAVVVQPRLGPRPRGDEGRAALVEPAPHGRGLVARQRARAQSAHTP